MSKDPSHPIDGSGDGMTQEILKLVRSIDERLISLEAKVDERLLDTRPIWERALAEIGELRVAQGQTNIRLDQLAAKQDQLAAKQDQLAAGQDQLRTELRDEMRMGFHKLERQLMRLSKDFLEIRTEMDMLEDRIEKLEPQAST